MSPTSTSSRPLRTAYADPGGSPCADQHRAGRQVDDQGRALEPVPRGVGERGQQRQPERSSSSVRAQGRGDGPLGRGVRRQDDGWPFVDDLLVLERGVDPAQRQGEHRDDQERDDGEHPAVVEDATAVAGVGSPMITTRIAMPRTPPSWRALETTADAVAYRPPGTAARAALPSRGRVAPTPMPLSTWPGIHSAQNAGSSPTRWWYQR